MEKATRETCAKQKGQKQRSVYTSYSRQKTVEKQEGTFWTWYPFGFRMWFHTSEVMDWC